MIYIEEFRSPRSYLSQLDFDPCPLEIREYSNIFMSISGGGPPPDEIFNMKLKFKDRKLINISHIDKLINCKINANFIEDYKKEELIGGGDGDPLPKEFFENFRAS